MGPRSLERHRQCGRPEALLFVVRAAALAWIDLDVHRPSDLLVFGAVAISALLAVPAGVPTPAAEC
jgi:hypothetical protein